MKKLFMAGLMAVLCATIFAGCNFSAPQTSSNSSDTASGDTLNAADGVTSGKGDNLTDFANYMLENEFISGDSTETSASLIGASKGVRFTMSSGTSKYFVELYEYDLANINNTASTTIANAKADGSFTLFDNTTSATQNTIAAVSADGRFLMLYTDASTNENNVNRKNDAVAAVQNYNK